MLAIGAMAPRFTIFHINEIPPSSGKKYLGENGTVLLAHGGWVREYADIGSAFCSLMTARAG